MRLIVEFNNETTCRFTAKKLERIFEKTITASSLAQLAGKDVEISVAFVSGEEIQKLNKQYRGKNQPTDVLSFAEYEHADMLMESQENVFLGELIVCPEFVQQSAKERSIAFQDEIVYVLSHGLLHLLGFSHGKKMYAIQQSVVDALVGKNPVVKIQKIKNNK